MKKLICLILGILMINITPVYSQVFPWSSPCSQTEWTPTDGSGAIPALIFTIDTSDGVYNSVYCRLGNRVWISSLIHFPITTDVNKAKLSLPFPTMGYDTAISIGGCLGPADGFCSTGGMALVSPASWLKFTKFGGIGPAVSNSFMSGSLILISGSYLTGSP